MFSTLAAGFQRFLAMYANPRTTIGLWLSSASPTERLSHPKTWSGHGESNAVCQLGRLLLATELTANKNATSAETAWQSSLASTPGRRRGGPAQRGRQHMKKPALNGPRLFLSNAPGATGRQYLSRCWRSNCWQTYTLNMGMCQGFCCSFQVVHHHPLCVAKEN